MGLHRHITNYCSSRLPPPAQLTVSTCRRMVVIVEQDLVGISVVVLVSILSTLRNTQDAHGGGATYYTQLNSTGNY